MAKKNKGGRPTKMTPEVLRKLEQAFAVGCTDREACVYAGVAYSTFSDYCRKNPEFSDQKEALKTAPGYKARVAIMEALEAGDVKTAKWVLDKIDGKAGQKLQLEHRGEVEVVKRVEFVSQEDRGAGDHS